MFTSSCEVFCIRIRAGRQHSRRSHVLALAALVQMPPRSVPDTHPVAIPIPIPIEKQSRGARLLQA